MGPWLVPIATILLPTLVYGAGEPVSADSIFHWRPFLAPFHAVVLHFPIGFITVAFILEIYRTYRPSEDLRKVTVLIIWLSLLSGIVAAGFGWMRAAGGGYEVKAVNLHRYFGMAVPFVTLATLAIQRKAYRDETKRIWTHGYRGLLTGTMALIVVAGHFGGNLTHGSRYLVENAPKFVRDFLEARDTPRLVSNTSTEGTLEVSQEVQFYREKVRPIFESKCYGCHGPDKHKGGYRLDIPEHAWRGGDSEESAIVPGDPLAGMLPERILLPRDDDDVMPPDGKEPLTQEELGIILTWIREGAIFDQSSASIHQASLKD